MYILGIESSCDETSAAVVEADDSSRRIAADIVASQIDIHRLYGGVVPEIAGRAHIEAVTRITHEALDEAKITLGDVGLVAVTSHPGLIGALLVGVNFAKSLAVANGIPLVGVDHVRAHIAAAYAAYPDLAPPFLGVVLSGGHTSFYIVDGYASFHEIGSTRDDAAGEAFDKIGRVIGMPYPGGAAMDRLAYEGNPHAYKLPSPRTRGRRAQPQSHRRRPRRRSEARRPCRLFHRHRCRRLCQKARHGAGRDRAFHRGRGGRRFRKLAPARRCG